MTDVVRVEREDVGRYGDWDFSRHEVVGPELGRVFHELYEVAFAPLRTRAVARQVLTEAEFGELMVDRTVLKYVAWTLDGTPVGMFTLTKNFDTVPWVSPEYFAAHFTDLWARNAVWYCGFTLAHPSQRRVRLLSQMISVGVIEPLAEHGVCAYDMCAFNDRELALGDRLRVGFHQASGGQVDLIDSQNYYLVDFR